MINNPNKHSLVKLYPKTNTIQPTQKPTRTNKRHNPLSWSPHRPAKAVWAYNLCHPVIHWKKWHEHILWKSCRALLDYQWFLKFGTQSGPAQKMCKAHCIFSIQQPHSAVCSARSPCYVQLCNVVCEITTVAMPFALTNPEKMATP